MTPKEIGVRYEKSIKQYALIFLSCNMDEDMVEDWNEKLNTNLSLKEWEDVLETMIKKDSIND